MTSQNQVPVRVAVVGADVVVTRDVPDCALIYGNPGCQQGWMCRCGLALTVKGSAKTGRATCGTCGTAYRLVTKGGRTDLEERKGKDHSGV